MYLVVYLVIMEGSIACDCYSQCPSLNYVVYLNVYLMIMEGFIAWDCFSQCLNDVVYLVVYLMIMEDSIALDCYSQYLSSKNKHCWQGYCQAIVHGFGMTWIIIRADIHSVQRWTIIYQQNTCTPNTPTMEGVQLVPYNFMDISANHDAFESWFDQKLKIWMKNMQKHCWTSIVR